MQPLKRLVWPRLARNLFRPPLTDPAPPVPDDVVQALPPSRTSAVAPRAVCWRKIASRPAPSSTVVRTTRPP